MSRAIRWVVILLVLWVTVCAGILTLPYLLAVSAMPEDAVMTLHRRADGTLLLSWPRARWAGGYYVELARAENAAGEVLFSASCAARECALPADLPETETLAILVYPQREYRVLRSVQTRRGTPAAVLCRLQDPEPAGLDCRIDPDRDAVALRWDAVPGETAKLYLREQDGTLRGLPKPVGAEAVISFGEEDGQLPPPEWGGECRLELAVTRETPGLVFEGAPAPAATVRREDLIGNDAAAETSVLYATVWPLEDLTLYAGPDGGSAALGIAAAGAALRVLGEGNGMFRVRTEDGAGWVDSDYCMINLPDYLGDLCAYDITNSYASIFTVHGVPIPGVTGGVVRGFEQVRQADGTFLVPLLYPTAQKLAEAALSALADGCRLKIYEAFRPNEATRSVYDLTEAILRNPLPDGTDTYYGLMTGGAWSLGSFLAASVSMHNLGVAVDLTLETVPGGEEFIMQSAMHDLSRYSVKYADNENAALLSRYMTGAGLAGIVSEWWHFQDDALRNRLGLNSPLWSGVSAEGPAADAGGA